MAKGKVVHGTDGCVVLVEGDPKKRPEPSSHVIKFPGGWMELSRTSNDEYWAHLSVHKGQILDDLHTEQVRGTVTETRIDYQYPESEGGGYMIAPFIEEEMLDNFVHLAVRIRISNE